MDLWETLRPFIDQGLEARKVDLKQQIDLSTRPERAEFAKDVSAMANAPGGRGYIVIGVVDTRHRTIGSPADYVLGCRPSNVHVLDQQMVQALEYFCSPVPEIQYKELTHPAVPERTIGVVIIPRLFERPYRIVADSGKVKAGCYLRRGSQTYRVDCSEIASGPTAILLNFGRQIEETQRKQIETLLGLQVEEVIDIAHQLDDNQSYETQLLGKLMQVGLTEDEWTSLPLVVNIHPFAPAAAALVACIHGLRGNFPDIVRMKQNPKTRKFEVVEVLHLQSLRNDARRKVASP